MAGLPWVWGFPWVWVWGLKFNPHGSPAKWLNSTIDKITARWINIAIYRSAIKLKCHTQNYVQSLQRN